MSEENQSSSIVWITLVAIAMSLSAVVFNERRPAAPAYEGIWQECRQILETARDLEARSACDPEWADFELGARARLRSIADELELVLVDCAEQARNQTVEAHQERTRTLICRPLFHLGRDHLPSRIDAGRSGETPKAVDQLLDVILNAVRCELDAAKLHSGSDSSIEESDLSKKCIERLGDNPRTNSRSRAGSFETIVRDDESESPLFNGLSGRSHSRRRLVVGPHESQCDAKADR